MINPPCQKDKANKLDLWMTCSSKRVIFVWMLRLNACVEFNVT